MRYSEDDRETETLARSLIEHAALKNNSGRPPATISLAVQLLVAPLRYDKISPGEVLAGIASALGSLAALACQDDDNRGKLVAALCTSIGDTADQSAKALRDRAHG